MARNLCAIVEDHVQPAPQTQGHGISEESNPLAQSSFIVEWSFLHACKASWFLCMVILSLEVAQLGEYYHAFFRLHQKYLATEKLLLKTLTIAKTLAEPFLG